jgi:hypothetical protein
VVEDCRYRLDDDAPYIYRTGDGGSTWTRIDAGIPRDSFVNVVREDPVRKSLLYAGTEKGMYVSFDDGARWQSLQQNLPMTSVRDIKVHGNDLVIATHGRGFWIMDDISALRQIDAVHADAVTLFKPADTIRVRPVLFKGTPMPKDEPIAPNPPFGAIIDYVLPQRIKTPVTLAVFDVHGRKVCAFSSATKVAPPNPATLKFAPEWVPPPMILSAAPGMQRFVWNLRYPKSSTTAGSGSQPDGVWALPGDYTVELTVDGHQYRQRLVVRPDPRVKISHEALEREFLLAQNVERASAQVSAASADATKLLKALEARMTAAGAMHDQIAALIARVTDFSGIKLHPNPRNLMPATPRRTDSLRSLSIDLRKLEYAVDGADADPSPDALASYARVSKMLAVTLREWSELKNHDLAELNKRMTAAGEKPIAL